MNHQHHQQADRAPTKRAAAPRHQGENPTEYADLVGADYAGCVTVNHRKKRGLYLTPVSIARFMAAQIAATGNTIRVLDPAAGAGILLCATVEALMAREHPPDRIELVAYEVDRALSEVLSTVLDRLKTYAIAHGVRLSAEIVPADFVLEHAAALRNIGGFLPHLQPSETFDVVIANPPYFKLNKADPQAKAAATVVHGQPNIYGLFMAIGAALLRDCGELIFITPRSFASGPYFRLFRERFFGCIRPQLVHVFGSRRDAFNRDAVLQENVVLKGIREDDWTLCRPNEPLTISSSEGIADLGLPERRAVSLRTVLDMGSREKVLRLPVSDFECDLMRRVEGWNGSLRSYGLQISTGPVVPFRARELLDQSGDVPRCHVPLLWMNHVHAMRVTWPIGRHKPEYIKHVMDAYPILVPNRNYVLLRRFSAKEEKRRLVAGPYIAHMNSTSMIGLENHLNYIYRPKGDLTEDETFGLAALFNSALLDNYFRSGSGNTQVSATELRTMPLPPLSTITAIGRLARPIRDDQAAIDRLVMRLTTDARHETASRG